MRFSIFHPRERVAPLRFTVLRVLGVEKIHLGKVARVQICRTAVGGEIRQILLVEIAQARPEERGLRIPIVDAGRWILRVFQSLVLAGTFEIVHVAIHN